MLSQEKAQDPDTDWKKEDAQVLNELDAKEKEWGGTQQELLRTVLKLTFTFQGSNDLVDKKLQDLKGALKQSKSGIPKKEIEQIVEAILNFKKDNDIDSSRTNLLIENVLKLLSKESLSDIYAHKLQEINSDIQENSVAPVTQLKPLNDVISSVIKSAAKGKQKPDSFKVFLKKLSEHKNTETVLTEFCKRSISIKNDQEILKAINQCVEQISGRPVASAISSKNTAEHYHTIPMCA